MTFMEQHLTSGICAFTSQLHGIMNFIARVGCYVKDEVIVHISVGDGGSSYRV